MLTIPEAAIGNNDTVYRVNDPHFWDNYAAHLRAMVRFTNDAHDPVAGEDRNLWVDKIEFAPLP